MSPFFEPPPPPPELPGRPWTGRPPDTVLSRTVALNLVLARSDKAALWIPSLTAHPEGFEFGIAIRHRLEEGEFVHDVFGAHPRHRRPRPGEGLDPSTLRFGIQFADGGKSTTVDEWRPSEPGESRKPSEGPRLMPTSGGGGDGRWEQGFRVSPLPPEGPLAFVCEWPVAGIPETRSEIDSALVRDAAAEAVPLWPDDDDEGGRSSGSWTMYGPSA